MVRKKQLKIAIKKTQSKALLGSKKLYMGISRPLVRIL